MKFKIEYSCGNYWYIFCDDYDNFRWLLPNGIITANYREAMTNNWKTKKEAEEFLDNYLEEQKMNKMIIVQGKKVSEDTIVKALKNMYDSILEPEKSKFQFSMDWFHCGEREAGISYPYYVVTGEKFSEEKPPTAEEISNDAGFMWDKEDVKLMIKNLQKMIGENDE